MCLAHFTFIAVIGWFIFIFSIVIGGEVAIYCSHHFINTLKNTDDYKAGKIGEALKSTFMEIDEKLRDPNVKKVIVKPVLLSSACCLYSVT